MRNKLIDLNNHLFAALERLGDEDLDKETLATEIERSKAISGVAGKIIHNASVALDAQKHMDEYAYEQRGNKMPEIFMLAGVSGAKK